MMTMFLSGAIFMGFLTVGIFFARFWTKTHDRLFGSFSIAFILMAAERVLLLLTPQEDEVRTYVYLVRLVAFILIIWAIVDKNRQVDKQTE